MICEFCGRSPARRIASLVLCDRCARICQKILETGEGGVSKKEIEEIVLRETKEVALHFFFRDRSEAMDFFRSLGNRPLYLVECENQYGQCYDVVVCKEPPKTADELWVLGWREYEKACSYRSYIAGSHESTINPLDIAGIKNILIIHSAPLQPSPNEHSRDEAKPSEVKK